MMWTLSRTHSRTCWCAFASVALALLLGSRAQAASIFDFHIYAQNNVMVGGSTVVGTNLLPSLVGAGTMVVGVGDATVAGAAGINGDLRAGDDVTLGNNSFVTGTITNPDQFNAAGSATYGAHVTAMPDLPTLPPATVFVSGGLNQSVGNNATMTLAPGSYNNISLGGGATLNLSAGDYFLNMLTAGNALTLNVNVPVGITRLFITDDLSFGGTVAMNVTDDDPDRVRVETHSTSLNAFRIGGGSGTNWTGHVFTPNGGIHLGSGSSSGTINGYLWAGTNVDLEHGLDVIIPEPSSVVLLGLGMIGTAGYAWRRRRHTPSTT